MHSTHVIEPEGERSHTCEKRNEQEVPVELLFESALVTELRHFVQLSPIVRVPFERYNFYPGVALLLSRGEKRLAVCTESKGMEDKKDRQRKLTPLYIFLAPVASSRTLRYCAAGDRGVTPVTITASSVLLLLL